MALQNLMNYGPAAGGVDLSLEDLTGLIANRARGAPITPTPSIENLGGLVPSVPSVGGGMGGGGGFTPSAWDRFTGWTDPKTNQQHEGYGAVGLQAGIGALTAYLGFKNYQLNKKRLQEATRQFNLGYDAQVNQFNASLADTQAAREGAHGGPLMHDLREYALPARS